MEKGNLTWEVIDRCKSWPGLAAVWLWTFGSMHRIAVCAMLGPAHLIQVSQISSETRKKKQIKQVTLDKVFGAAVRK